MSIKETPSNYSHGGTDEFESKTTDAPTRKSCKKSVEVTGGESYTEIARGWGHASCEVFDVVVPYFECSVAGVRLVVGWCSDNGWWCLPLWVDW